MNTQQDTDIAAWKEYEYLVIKHHSKEYNQIVWHTDVIPEGELFNAGFINDYNRHRLCRIAKKREAEGKSIKYSDYGMDFLSKDEEGKYHAGQAKHYTKRKVIAKDIATFQSVVFCRIKNTGYLYTSCPLEVNLREDILNSNGMLIHHHLPFVTQDRIKITTDETTYPLRPYQEEAIKAILEKSEDLDSENDDYCNHNRKALELFCGGGKTIIAGHILKHSSYDIIVCIAPLKASVEQLKTRLTPFLPSYKTLLVYSEEEGTTDIDIVKKTIQDRTCPIIIFSTYKSAEDLLTEVFQEFREGMFLLVDEVHNMLSKVKLCDFANSFYNSLLLSATIPEELYDVLSVDKCYSYGMCDAIKNKYCCDYEVFLPYIDIERNKIDVDIPREVSQYDKSLSAKAMFLATGMLQTGSRRCIVYLANQDECDEFLRIARTVFDEYHSIPFWGEKIDSTVSSKKRNEIIQTFQENNNNHMIRIIASVRILDEAIDIPKCDSEFITVVGEQTSDIRTIQRLCRGCRLDSDNPMKKNNLFMWCSDWSNAINCLTLLKDADPEFHKKIRSINSKYDIQGEKEIQKMIQIQQLKLQDYVNIKCLSLDERWELRRQHWIEQYKKFGRKPSHHSKDVGERKAARWQDRMRLAIKGKGGSKLTGKRIEVLNNTKGWTWKEPDTFIHQYNNWLKQYNKLGKKPSCSSKDEDEKKAGNWQTTIRRSKKGYGYGKITEEQVEILNNTEGWTWEEHDAFTEQYHNWLDQYKKLGKKPSSHSKNVDERKASQWQSDMRKIKKGQGQRKLTIEQIEQLNDTEGWTWEEPDIFIEQYNNWIEQYKKLRRKPYTSSEDLNERKAGSWQSSIRQRKDKLSQEQVNILNNTEGWTWEEPDFFTEQYNNWLQQYNKLGRKPYEKSNDPYEKKAGQWQSAMRIAKKKPGKRTLTVEQIEILNNTEGWTWEKTDAFTEQYQHWQQQFKKLGRKPSHHSKDVDERKAGQWQNKMRLAKRGNALCMVTEEQIEILNNTDGWTWEQSDAFTEQYNKWVEQYKRLGRKPCITVKDFDEKKAGIWQSHMRQAKKGNGTCRLTEEQIEILNNTDGWTWEKSNNE